MLDLIFSPDGFLVAALGLLALAVCVIPLLDHRKSTPDAEPPTPMTTYRQTMVMLWVLAAVCVAGWLLSGRTLEEIGWRPVAPGWGGLLAWALAGSALVYCLYQIVGTAVSAKTRASVRRQLGQVELDLVRPQSREDAVAFQALSITAGVTEEVIFRGVLLVSISLVAPLWAAALISLAAFILLHAYQGLGGLVRVAPTAVFLTAIVLAGGSLWPAILAHIVIDMAAGAVFAILDRTEAQDRRTESALAAAPPAP